VRNFRAIFDAADAALLTQCKDNKAKSAEKSRRQAMCVQLLPPKTKGKKKKGEGYLWLSI
jgi:hypothetical protein